MYQFITVESKPLFLTADNSILRQLSELGFFFLNISYSVRMEKIDIFHALTVLTVTIAP